MGHAFAGRLGEKAHNGARTDQARRLLKNTPFMPERRTIRVLLVEDHAAFRQALAFLLSSEPDM